LSWKSIANWGRHSPLALRLADRLGRGKGRLRLFDRLNPPPPAPHKPDLSNWQQQELAAIWVGHATVLLRLGGMTILTDPVFSSHVGLGLGLMTAGPRRYYAAALRPRDLPPIDLILISHSHFDHLDRPSLLRLPKRTPIVTARNTRDLIEDLGFKEVIELDWRQKTTVGSVTLTAVEVNHWGARTIFDRHRGYNAYLLETAHHRVLYGGDTAYFEGFKFVGKVDLAILGIGAYDPYIHAHATPEQVWQMADQVDADYLLPIHHTTFRLSHEPMDEPIQRILTQARKEGKEDRVIVREIGGQWHLNGQARR
jgi:L-ascorbate metabolism protein UlaG (beta-lactamase superfamily)